MQLVREPDVDIERHAPVAELLDRLVEDRHAALHQAREEGLPKDDAILEERRVSCSLRLVEEQAGLDDVAAGHARASLAAGLLLPEELDVRRGDAVRLVPQALRRLAANAGSGEQWNGKAV